MFNKPQPHAEAFLSGKSDYLEGKAINTNPFEDLDFITAAKLAGAYIDGALAVALAHEWKRGWKNARKSARFNGTIARRKIT